MHVLILSYCVFSYRGKICLVVSKKLNIYIMQCWIQYRCWLPYLEPVEISSHDFRQLFQDSTEIRPSKLMRIDLFEKWLPYFSGPEIWSTAWSNIAANLNAFSGTLTQFIYFICLFTMLSIKTKLVPYIRYQVSAKAKRKTRAHPCKCGNDWTSLWFSVWTVHSFMLPWYSVNLINTQFYVHRCSDWLLCTTWDTVMCQPWCNFHVGNFITT